MPGDEYVRQPSEKGAGSKKAGVYYQPRATEQPQLLYDKVKWPRYEDAVFTRRKNALHLPQHVHAVKGMLGLKKGAREGDGMEEEEEGPPQKKSPSKKRETSAAGSARGGLPAGVSVGKLGASSFAGKAKLGGRLGSGQSRLGAGGRRSSRDEKEFGFGKAEWEKMQATKFVVRFDADFESANLEQVRRKAKGVYDVFIRNDSNGSKNLQWFYFRMRNADDFVGRIKINIVNFTKGNSLFLKVSDSVPGLTVLSVLGHEAILLV